MKRSAVVFLAAALLAAASSGCRPPAGAARAVARVFRIGAAEGAGAGAPKFTQQALKVPLREVPELRPLAPPVNVAVWKAPVATPPRAPEGLFPEPPNLNPLVRARPTAPPPVDVPTVPSDAEAVAARNLKLTTELKDAVANKDWERAQAILERTPPGLRPEVAKQVTAAKDAAENLKRLGQVKEVLASQKPAREAEPLIDALSPSDRSAVRHAIDCEELAALLGSGKWEKGGLARVEKLLDGYAERADPKSVNRVRVYLATCAHDGGDPTAARRLIPADAPAESLPPKLRDLRRPADGGNGFTAPAPRPVVPEPVGGTRATTEEAFTAGLPELKKEVQGAAAEARKRATKAVEDSYQGNLNGLQQPLARLTNQLLRDDEKHPANPGPVPTGAKTGLAGLGRPVTATDRILINAMRAKGKSDADIVAALKALDADQE